MRNPNGPSIEEREQAAEAFEEMNKQWQAYFPLSKKLGEHGVTLNLPELEELVLALDKSRTEAYGVVWILVNAVRSLDQEQLKRLHQMIASHIQPSPPNPNAREELAAKSV